MAFNGSGTFNPYTPGNPVVTGTTISSTAFNATITDLASGLSNTVTRDGQSPATANIPMGGFKHTGLAAGTVAGDSLRFQQLFSQGNPAILPSAATVDIGGQNSVAVEISGTTPITSLGTNYNGPRYLRFQGVLTLTHNATTLNINGGANVTTAAGDIAIAYPNSALNGWNVTFLGAVNAFLGSATATTQPPGDNSTKVATTAYADAASSGQTQIQQPTVTNPSNTLVISFPQLTLAFRNTTLTTGTTTNVTGTPASLTIAATDSFGLVTAAGRQRLAILAINNSGTIELAASALYGGVSLDETGVITTATASTTASGIKAAAVRTGVAYRVIGFVDATFTTAVGWGTVALVQGVGGQALTALSSFGYGQTWQDVTGSRALGTTYYNNTGKTFTVAVSVIGSIATDTSFTVNGLVVSLATASTTIRGMHVFAIPPGGSYLTSSANSTLVQWREFR